MTALATVAGRSGNLAMAMPKGTAAATYTPKFAYATNIASNNVSVYSINASTWALTAGTPVAAGTNPLS